MAVTQRRGGHLVRAIIIHWDGKHLPDELRQLPPGRYIVDSISNIDDPDDLTPEEEAGIRLALDEAEAGQALPWEDAVREIRSRD
jgi:hypothetical protein